MLRTLEINDWNEICDSFESFFKDLGGIELNDDYIQFNSYPKNVPTSFSISKQGKFAAAMPLHGLDGSILTVQFDYDKNTILVIGSETKYVYKVPSEILAIRK